MTPETPILPTAQPDDSPFSIDIVESIAAIWKQRKVIAYFVGACTVLSIAVSLLLPEYYKSTATILPETDKSKLSSLGGLSDLASLAGVNVGGEGSLAKLYPTILKSEAVLGNVILARYMTNKFKDSVDLIQYWEIAEKKPGSAFFDALTSLRKRLDVAIDAKTSVITVSIETTDKQLSADVLNNLLANLDKFVRTKRTTNASEQRKFIEARLDEVKEDLSRSENRLKEFRETNVQVRSPQLQLDEGRLLREVQINSTIFMELKKQYEIVKIEEVKNLPVVNVLDSATPAVYKESPRRSIIVLSVIFVSCFLAFAYVLFGQYYGKRMSSFVRRVKELPR